MEVDTLPGFTSAAVHDFHSSFVKTRFSRDWASAFLPGLLRHQGQQVIFYRAINGCNRLRHHTVLQQIKEFPKHTKITIGIIREIVRQFADIDFGCLPYIGHDPNGIGGDVCLQFPIVP